MSNKDHRLGVSEINLVTRHLKLEPNDEVAIRAAVADIDQLYGLDGVSFDEKKWRLDLAYDASRVCLDCVEDILMKHAVEISHDWWTRFKEEHYRFVDQNVKDNANHEPWSCHQSLPGSGKKK
ncbi:MAG: cation transporter [Halomonas sp.]|uniref:Cation transporter n=1 Tax=Halomonas sulfidivorans TaxID=2733488 RepID=A0ABX7WG48_9GAMM|nr:cation transporter [Halomonas sulfidivorans]MDX5377556.1 cation transporter [Halomonas sp.]QTP58457.1 cation transporter [Halomonas sulfidivorans]